VYPARRNAHGGVRRFENAKARAVVWTFPTLPTHREPLYSKSSDLVADYPTYEDKKFGAFQPCGMPIQEKTFRRIPIILISGRL
jgi:formate dehydrogenase major subunit